MAYNPCVLKLATMEARKRDDGGGDAGRTRGIGVRGPGYASNRNFAGTRATGARLRTSRSTSHRKLWPWKKDLRTSGSFSPCARLGIFFGASEGLPKPIARPEHCRLRPCGANRLIEGKEDMR